MLKSCRARSAEFNSVRSSVQSVQSKFRVGRAKVGPVCLFRLHTSTPERKFSCLVVPTTIFSIKLPSLAGHMFSYSTSVLTRSMHITDHFARGTSPYTELKVKSTTVEKKHKKKEGIIEKISMNEWR